jgi:hypothetical protein
MFTIFFLCRYLIMLLLKYMPQQKKVTLQSDDYLKNPDKQAKVKKLEAQIDQLVYKLYDLTPEGHYIGTFYQPTSQ